MVHSDRSDNPTPSTNEQPQSTRGSVTSAASKDCDDGNPASARSQPQQPPSPSDSSSGSSPPDKQGERGARSSVSTATTTAHKFVTKHRNSNTPSAVTTTSVSRRSKSGDDATTVGRRSTSGDDATTPAANCHSSRTLSTTTTTLINKEGEGNIPVPLSKQEDAFPSGTRPPAVGASEVVLGGAASELQGMSGVGRFQVGTKKKFFGLHRKKRFMEVRSGHVYLFKGMNDTYPTRVENLSGAGLQHADDHINEVTLYGPFCTAFHFKYKSAAVLHTLQAAIDAHNQYDEDMTLWPQLIQEGAIKAEEYTTLCAEHEQQQQAAGQCQSKVQSLRTHTNQLVHCYNTTELNQQQINMSRKAHDEYIPFTPPVAQLTRSSLDLTNMLKRYNSKKK